MSGEVHGCKSCGGSHFGHNDCPFAEIAEAGSKGETSTAPAAEKPKKRKRNSEWREQIRKGANHGKD